MLQVSSVQTLPSLQTTGVPEHEPPEQTSPVVQGLLSLHGSLFGVPWQVPAPQVSFEGAVFDERRAERGEDVGLPAGMSGEMSLD